MVKRRSLLQALVAAGMVAMVSEVADEQADETRRFIGQIRNDWEKSPPTAPSTGGSLDEANVARSGMQCPQIT